HLASFSSPAPPDPDTSTLSLHDALPILAVGDTVIAGSHVDVKPGNVMPLGNMPIGTIIHNVELKIGKGGQLARSAGTYAQLVGRDRKSTRLNSSHVAISYAVFCLKKKNK